MRLFLAIKPDRPAEGRLGQRVLQVQDAIGGMSASLRWTPIENIHATLHFLGEVNASQLAHLREHLGTAVAGAPFEIGLGEPGVFPATGAPRVVWLDIVQGRERVAQLHAELGRRLVSAEMALESRAFSPHVTIARVPDRERARVKLLRDQLRDLAPVPIVWLADRVTLFRSDLTGPVPRYEPIHEISLE